MNVVKLIQYTHAARRRYLKAFGELSWDEVVKDRGASYPSVRDIFLHALDVEDRFINYIIPGKTEKWASQDYGKFTNTRQIEERMDEVEKKVDEYLATLTEHELNRKIAIPWRKDPPLHLRAEDMLVNIVIEDASHMGELIALMWQFDKQPPFLGWSSFIEQNP
ncbi:MAG: DinB family protein [Candidatus Bathyarchaeota archaeon]